LALGTSLRGLKVRCWISGRIAVLSVLHGESRCKLCGIAGKVGNDPRSGVEGVSVYRRDCDVPRSVTESAPACE
jgi:hypothetical protein